MAKRQTKKRQTKASTDEKQPDEKQPSVVSDTTSDAETRAQREPEPTPKPEPQPSPAPVDEDVVNLANRMNQAGLLVRGVERLAKSIGDRPAANEYHRVAEYLEKAAVHAQSLTDLLTMARDEYLTVERKVADIREANERRERVRRETFRVRATIRDLTIDPKDADAGPQDHVQQPAQSWPSREAAIAAWSEGGSEYRRIMESVSRPSTIEIVGLVVIDGDGNEETVK